MNRATGLLLIALLLAVVFFLSLPGTTAWQRVVQDAGHGPVFACIAVVLLLMLRGEAGGAGSRLHERNAPVLAGGNPLHLPDHDGADGEVSPAARLRLFRRAFLIAVAIGIVSEIVQYFQPLRNVSIFDVLHDAAGAALGLSLFAWWERRKRGRPGESTRSTAWLVTVVLGSVVLLAWQPIRCATAYAQRNRAFPTLLQATHHVGGYFARARAAEITRSMLPAPWRRDLASQVAGQYEDDDTALRLSFVPGTKPALELEEPAADWRGYDALKLDLTNPSDQPLWLTLRILDAEHDWSHADRFNVPITIPAGSRVTVQVSLAAVASSPRDRHMDMAAIRNVMLFSRRPVAGTEFYVSRLWLE